MPTKIKKKSLSSKYNSDTTVPCDESANPGDSWHQNCTVSLDCSWCTPKFMANHHNTKWARKKSAQAWHKFHLDKNRAHNVNICLRCTVDEKNHVPASTDCKPTFLGERKSVNNGFLFPVSSLFHFWHPDVGFKRRHDASTPVSFLLPFFLLCNFLFLIWQSHFSCEKSFKERHCRLRLMIFCISKCVFLVLRHFGHGDWGQLLCKF